MDRIIATIASMPGRVLSLEETINSMIDQVDEIWVYLNYEHHVPKYLKHPKIKVSSMIIGDLGDAGKFYASHLIRGYHFTIDDDIIYPSDYVSKTIETIDKYSRGTIVSYHGRRFGNKPVISYYKGATHQFCFLKTVYHDEIIDVPGTGVMAYHTQTIQFSIEDFAATNMADIWVGKKARENNTSITILAHQKQWLKESKLTSHHESIYSNMVKNDVYQTKVINSFI
jgi:hypothetical protein